jgi:tetratricopeptide (TPR) repeat protein
MPRAREAAEKALALDPSLAEAQVWLARAYARVGRFSEALAEARKAQQLEGSGNTEIEGALGRAYADAGNRTEAIKILTRLRECARNEFVSSTFIATIHIGLGEVDEALAALTQAEQEHSYWVGWWKVDPELDRCAPTRASPRC